MTAGLGRAAADGTTSPGGHDATSPGGHDATSPGRHDATSPGRHSATSPGRHSATSPGGQDTTSPGGQDTTSPGGQDTTSPGAPAPTGGSGAAPGRAVLVVVDMQPVFADPGSPWAAPRFAEALPVVRSLAEAAGADRTVFTRFVAPEHPTGAWVAYYADWPFALQPEDAPAYAVVPELADLAARAPVVTATTFGKWGPDLAAHVGPGDTMLLTGVSTDCCVLSTALAAADAGVAVRVVAEACTGADDASHARALDAIRLYAPLADVIDATTARAVLATTSA
ncbi:isochorismatase family protein [Cellulomonas sp. ES6]|uniref:cysteine hydrolase family protein n=1 Tax=Cellulomonas sp. ES6 TaxID=3039384 RepID=UPI0032D579D5